jgi:energy-coupling factor transporter ATP-binding protein EcfA2
MTTPARPAKRAPTTSINVTSRVVNPGTTPSRPAVTASSNPFADSIDTRTSQGKFLMLYGESGEGKTSLAANFPKPLFIATSGEQGVFLLKQKGVIPKDTPVISLPELYPHDEIPDGSGHPGWITAMEEARKFRDEPHPFQTLVFDSVSGLQDLCFQHCASRLYKGDIDGDDFNGWQRGYTKAAESFWSSEFLPILLGIVAKGLNVILIAHSTYRQVENPSGPDFSRFQPALQKNVWEFTKKDLHGVFYLGREVKVAVDRTTKKKTTMGDRRFIGLAPSTYYVAKTWCTPEGTEELECGATAKETWSILKEALGM